MDVRDFVQDLSRRGYGLATPGNYEPHCFNDTHSHPFDVRGLILSGEMTLTLQGQSTTYRTGEVFIMPVGVPHQEHVGEQGVEYLWAAAHSQPPA